MLYSLNCYHGDNVYPATVQQMTQWSISFVIYHPHLVIPLNDTMTIEVQDPAVPHLITIVATGQGTISHCSEQATGLIVTLRLRQPWKLENHLQLSAEQKLQSLTAYWETQVHQLDPNYQRSVDLLGNFLCDLNTTLNQLVTFHAQDSTQIIEEAITTIVPAIQAFCVSFNTNGSRVTENNRAAHIQYARKVLHPLILCSPFFYHTFTKPLGYAGDYHMVNHLTKETFEGNTLFAKLIDYCATHSDVAEAHRNRLHILESTLVSIAKKAKQNDKVAYILNIGCGPAIEIQRFFRHHPTLAGYVHFLLVDFDQEAIDYARTTLQGIRHAVNVEYVMTSVYDLLRHGFRSIKPNHAGFDFIYCAGLFDYLSDKVCQRLLTSFSELTNEEGEILVTNVTTENSSRYFMEHLLDWFLIYRNKKEMLNLAEAFDYPSIVTDKTGANIFLTIAPSPVLLAPPERQDEPAKVMAI